VKRFLACTSLFVALFGAMPLRGQAVVTETFKNSTTADANWVFAGSGYMPNLTSGVTDTAGDGWLRLTSTGGNQATSAYYNQAFTAANATVYAKFDFESYGGTGADGITFFLYDGSKTFGVGAYGGSIGYAQKTLAGGGGSNINGMNGGYLGVALDEYGNFSSASEGRVGGLNGTTGLVPDSIGVRGPGQGLSGYAFLGGSGTLAQSIDSASRPTATNTVQVLLSATNQLTVTLQQGGTSPQTVIQMDLSGYARPETLKFGFSAGTGGANNYHDIRNLNVTTLSANLWSGTAANGLWATNTNWNPTVVPTVGADILFDNTYVTTNQTIDTGTSRSVRSLSFDAPTNFTLNNNTFTFDSQGVPGFSGISVSQTHGTATNTINSALSLSNSIYVRNNSTGTLNVNGNISAGSNSITLDGTGINTTLSGIISGTGASVIKNDAGTATLSGANTYTGGTTINNGTLNANNATALGSGTVTLGGGTLASTNGSSLSNNLTLTASSGLSGATTSGTLTQTNGAYTLAMSGATQTGNVNLSNNNTGRVLTVQVDSVDSAINGVIADGGSGAGGLTKTGAATLTLGGANTYTGTTTITGGTLTLAASDRLADASAVTIGAVGTLNLNGKSERIGTLTAEGGATLDYGAPGGVNTFIFGTYSAPASGVLVVNNYENGTDKMASTVAGQDVSTIYFSGLGLATESATQTANIGAYTGANAYLITPAAVSGKEWNGGSSVNWNTNGNWTTSGKPSTTQLAIFNTLGVNQPNVTLNGANTVAGVRFGTGASANYDIGGTFALTLNGTLPYIQQQSASNQTISTSGGLVLGANTVVDITGAGNLTISAPITSTAKNLFRDGGGSGKLILSGNNSGHTGSVFVNTGVVQAANTNALGTGATTVSSGASLELSGGIAPTNNISIASTGVGGNGAIRNVSGTNTLSGTITETAAAKITADTGTTLNLTGNLTGVPVTGPNVNTTFAGAGNINVAQITTGTGQVDISTTGTVTYNGGTTANTYTGLTTVNSGTLSLNKTAGTNAITTGGLLINGGSVSLAANNQIADGASVTIANSGIFNVNGKSETIGQLSSTSATATTALGTGSLTIAGPNNTNSNYAGILTGAAGSSLNVGGTGKVYLTGNGSGFAGTTNVTNGTLNISGSNSVLGTGAVNVSSVGNLQMQGGISIGNNVSIDGTGTSGNGAIQNFAGNNAINGTVTVAGNSRIQSDASTLTLGGGVALGSNTLNVGGSGNVSITGAISGLGGLTKDGLGTLTLGAANSFSGTTVISAGTIVASASSAFNNSAALTVGSSGTLSLQGTSQTIGSLGGSGTVSLGSGGSLTLSGGSDTFSGTFVVPTLSTGTIIIGPGATLTLGANFNNPNLNITLAGGSLALNGTNSTFGNLNVTASSALDFGNNSASILNFNSVSLSPSVALSVSNWVNTVDYFYTQNFAGVTTGVRNQAPQNQIAFANFSNTHTFWGSDKQITPAPEPATYGMIFIGASLGLALFRRYRRQRAAA
jgi:fibronectin-binding autotransporter adhesin